MLFKIQYPFRSFKKLRLILLLLIVSPALLFAQKKAKKEALASMREFVDICNSYKKMPLQLNVTILRNADVITRPEDTLSSSAEFFITQKGTYVKVDELEQVANDSLILFISENAKRMMLYPSHTPVSAQIGNYIGMQLQDSSLEKMSKKYVVNSLEPDENEKGAQTIELQSRDAIITTSLPKETVEVTYDPLTREPKKVVQVSRKLIPLDSSEYSYLSKQPGYADKLIAAGSNVYFLINKHTTSFIYKRIDNSDKIVLPEDLHSYVTKNAEGKYMPAKKYGEFTLTENL